MPYTRWSPNFTPLKTHQSEIDTHGGRASEGGIRAVTSGNSQAAGPGRAKAARVDGNFRRAPCPMLRHWWTCHMERYRKATTTIRKFASAHHGGIARTSTCCLGQHYGRYGQQA